MKKNNLFKIILSILVLVCAFSVIGYSSYVIYSDAVNNYGDFEYDDTNSDDELVDVTLKYYAYTDFVRTVYDTEYYDVSAGRWSTTETAMTSITGNYTSSGANANFNNMNTILKNLTGQDYSAYDNNTTQSNTIRSGGIQFASTSTPSDTSHTYIIIFYAYDSNGGNDGITINATFTSGGLCGSDSYSISFSGQYRIVRQEIADAYTTSSSSNSIVDTFSIKSNTQLSEKNVVGRVTGIDLSSYVYMGSYSADNSGGMSTVAFDYSQPLTADTTIYLLYSNNTENMPTINLDEQIKSLSSGSTLTVSASGSTHVNITNEMSYFEKLKTFGLGRYNSSTQLTVPSNTTVNFCLNNGNVFSNSGTQGVVEPEGNRTNNYTIVLQQDLYIYGTMTIGGVFGHETNLNQLGHISGDYVTLDLNGFNIFIKEGGSLSNYGLIKDTCDSGKIYNQGGTYTSLVVLFDYRGGSNTSDLKNGGKLPFLYYYLPYTRCEVFLTFDDDSSTRTYGTFIGLLRVKPTSYSVTPATTATLNFCGPTSDSFFHITGDNGGNSSETYVSLNTYRLNDVGVNNDNLHCVLYRNQWNLKNVKFSVEGLSMTIYVAIDTNDLQFPLSPFFEIKLFSSRMTFSQSIQIPAGSSIFADKESHLIFDYVGSSRGAELSIMGNAPNQFSNYNKSDNGFLGYKSNCVSGFDFASAIITSKALCRYFGRASVNNFGTTWFKTGNQVGSSYLLAGEFNCDKFGFIASESNIDTSTPYSISENPNALKEIGNNGVILKTYDYSALGGNSSSYLKSRSMPLVSNDVAYVFDNTANNSGYYDAVSYGTYNYETGILTLAEKTYIFNVGTSFSISNQTISIVECTYNDSTHMATVGSTKYIYFSDCFYPVTTEGTSNCTINIGRAVSGGTRTVSYNTTHHMWLA